MKILYLLPEFPYPARSGGALRTLGLISGVADAGHEVHLLSFGNLPDTDTPLHGLCRSIEFIEPPDHPISLRLKTLLFSRRADMQQRRLSAHFKKALIKKLHEDSFDVIQFESLEMTPYVEIVQNAQPDARLIYDAYNAESEIQRMAYQTDRENLKRLPLSLYSWIQWRRLVAYEGILYPRLDAIVAVSEADRELISTVKNTAPVFLVPNGISVRDYENIAEPGMKLKQPALVFTGTMGYRPNVDAAVWFVREILPQIPDAHFYIVGNRPAARVLALNDHDNVTVTGFVPEVLPYLSKAAVFVAPLRIGSGTRLKLLEAMALQKAIVATTTGAMGLGVENGREMLLADDPENFAAAVRELIENEGRRAEMGLRARQAVEAHFDWPVIVPELLKVYEAVQHQES